MALTIMLQDTVQCEPGLIGATYYRSLARSSGALHNVIILGRRFHERTVVLVYFQSPRVLLNFPLCQVTGNGTLFRRGIRGLFTLYRTRFTCKVHFFNGVYWDVESTLILTEKPWLNGNDELTKYNEFDSIFL